MSDSHPLEPRVVHVEQQLSQLTSKQVEQMQTTSAMFASLQNLENQVARLIDQYNRPTNWGIVVGAVVGVGTVLMAVMALYIEQPKTAINYNKERLDRLTSETTAERVLETEKIAQIREKVSAHEQALSVIERQLTATHMRAMETIEE